MSLGSFLKRATTIPSHGILSPLRKVFGSTPLDELGQVGGFIVGGPAGAAAGGALGSLVHGAGIGSAIKNAATGYAGGVGANAALSGLGGGGLGGALHEVSSGLNPILKAGQKLGNVSGLLGGGSSVDAAGQPRSSGIGGAIGSVLGTFGGQNGAENQLRALGLLGSTAGAYMEGQATQNQQNFTNDQVSYARERNAALDPQRQAVMNALLTRLGGSPIAPNAAPPAGFTPVAAGPSAAPLAYTAPQTPQLSPPLPLSPAAPPAPPGMTRMDVPVLRSPASPHPLPLTGYQSVEGDEDAPVLRRPRRPGIGAAIMSSAY